jgi:predicted nucleic acid-binding protein
MIAVCNSSPIIALAGAGQLELLPALYGQIILPDAVFEEITVAGAGEPGAHEIAQAAWVTRQSVRSTPLVAALCIELDAGEADAIALAVESNADLILLDERIGRRAAKRLGLTAVGTLGILIAAKDRGLLATVRPALDALRVNAGFWITDELYSPVLNAANEQPHLRAELNISAGKLTVGGAAIGHLR